MATNVWGCDYRMCVSERAFGPYLSRESEKSLHRIYREMHLKRFHYSNAAMNIDGNFTDFYSYYTRICTVYKPINNCRVILCLYPFIYDADNFRNSPTTNKQFTKFIKEYINAYITAYDVRYIYKQLINGNSVPSLKTYSGKEISLTFSDMNYYISDNKIRACLSKSTQHAYCILNNFGYYAPGYEVKNYIKDVKHE